PHAAVDVLDDLAVGRQVDALQPQVDDPDADGGGAPVDRLQLLLDDLGTIAGHDLLQGAGVDLVAQRVLDDRREAIHGDAFIAARGAIERTHVLDHADGEEVHRHVLALGSQVALRLCVQYLQATVEDQGALDQRPLEVQAGADVGPVHAAQVQHHGDLALADHVGAAHQAQDQGDDECDDYRVPHRLASSRPVGRGPRPPRVS